MARLHLTIHTSSNLAIADLVSCVHRGKGERERIDRLALRTLPESQVLVLQTADIHSLCAIDCTLHEQWISAIEVENHQRLSVLWPSQCAVVHFSTI